MSDVKALEQTCGNCRNVNVEHVMGLPVVGCKETGGIIPHESDMHTQKVTFWRVPICCPRGDEAVKKSPKKAPKKAWVIKTFSELA